MSRKKTHFTKTESPLVPFMEKAEESLKERPPNSLDGFNLMSIRVARAAQMIARGATNDEIVLATGLNINQVKEIAMGRAKIDRQVLNALMAVEPDKWTLVQHRMLDSLLDMSDEQLAKLDPMRRATIAAIAVDKRALLNGNPTQIIDVRRSDDDILREMKELRQKLEIEPDFEVIAGDLPPPEKFEQP